MIDKNEIDKFLKRNEGRIKPETIHLTEQQKEIITGLSENMGVSFETGTMILMNVLLQELDKLYGQFLIEEQAKRN